MIDMGDLAAKAQIRATVPVNVLGVRLKTLYLVIAQQHCRVKVPWSILAKDNSKGQRLRAKADD
jgi:hypothetical protein